MTVERRQTPTLADVLVGAIDRKLYGVHTAIPARVESYDPTEQSVSVKPLIKRAVTDESGDRDVESLPIINSVPVVFPGAGAYSITFPIAKGDTVLLVFSEGSLDKWLQSGKEVDPSDDRRFNISDAIAIPGLRSFNNAVDDPGTNALVVTGSDIRLGSNSASDPVIRRSDLKNFIDAFNGHGHGSFSAGPASGTPTAYYGSAVTDNSPGSSKVKAE